MSKSPPWPWAEQKQKPDEPKPDPIHVEDDAGYSKHHFAVPHFYLDCISDVIVPKGMIVDRIEKLALDIANFYKGEQMHIVCLLKGSRGFFNLLLSFLNKIYMYKTSDPINKPPYLEYYVRVKSYCGTKSTNELKVISDDLSCLKDKTVLVIEDIIDTGFTLTGFGQWLQENVQPRMCRVATLLEKRTPLSNGFRGDFVGFSIPDKYLVGFNMDYNEIFRDMEHLCGVNQFGLEKFADHQKKAAVDE